MSRARVTWTAFFFSPTGRFARAQYWGASFAVGAVVAAYFLPLAALDTASLDAHPVLEAVYIAIGAAVAVAGVAAHMFTIVKRFHDRDKPWPYCLVLFVPYVGGLWILLECGCMPGTDGPNRFGADPRDRFFATPEPLEKPGETDAAARRRRHSF